PGASSALAAARAPPAVASRSLHDALPIYRRGVGELDHRVDVRLRVDDDLDVVEVDLEEQVGLDDFQALVDQGRGVEGDHRPIDQDRKSTRLNSSHVSISYAVFCLKKQTRR